MYLQYSKSHQVRREIALLLQPGRSQAVATLQAEVSLSWKDSEVGAFLTELQLVNSFMTYRKIGNMNFIAIVAGLHFIIIAQFYSLWMFLVDIPIVHG